MKNFNFLDMLECVKARRASNEDIAGIKKMQSDEVVFFGRKVGEYATAALDVIGVEKYDGKNENVIDCITFLQQC